MIGGITQHGRTKKDSGNLIRHLLKEDGLHVELLNSAAPDLHSIVSDMELGRDGSKADAAFLHMYISPSRNMTREEMMRAADITLEHFGASDHQAAIVFHNKPRIAGEGENHIHIVVGRVGPDGTVLPSGFDKIRMETAMRLVEFELGENPTLGRHTASGIRWMRKNGHEKAADWLSGFYGENPEKPKSAITASSRQMLERKNISVSEIRETVLAAWNRSDDTRSFMAAMNDVGLSIDAGKKKDVFIVRHGDTEIGSLDRLLKQKRGDIAAKMGEFKHDTIKSNASNESNLSRDKSEPRGSRKIEPIASTIGTERSNGRGADRTNTRSSERYSVESEAHYDSGGRLRKESRLLDKKSALIRLDKVRLSASSAISVQDIKTKNVGKPVSKFEANLAIHLIEAHKKGWHWIKEYKDDLIQKIKDFQSRLSSRSAIPERPVTPVRNKEPNIDPDYSGPRFG